MQNVTEFAFIEQDRPVLEAELRGGEKYPDMRGKVYVYDLPDGIYLQGDFQNMPKNSNFALHVHKGLLCAEIGDKLLEMPDIFSDGSGSASAQISVDRANHTQIADKPIVLHLKSNNEEIRVACGLLKRVL